MSSESEISLPGASDLVLPDSRPAPRRKRRSLPRSLRVALSLSKGTITFLLFALFVLIGGAFGAGLLVGLRVREAPMVVEKIVVKETPQPVAMDRAVAAPAVVAQGVVGQGIATPAIAVQAEQPKPKLNIIVGPPDDASAWGVQIGAFPDLASAEASLDARVAALMAHPIYIVPAEIKGKGIWHRVRVGTFKTKAEAERARSAMPEDLATQSMVVSYK